VIEFARSECLSCLSHDQCTAAARGNRMLSLQPRELHETTAANRAAQKTDTWQAKYALRAGIEGTLNQALDLTGLRRARYRGLPKVTRQHAFSATAINVIRLDAHWASQQTQRPTRTRTSRLRGALLPHGWYRHITLAQLAAAFLAVQAAAATRDDAETAPGPERIAKIPHAGLDIPAQHTGGPRRSQQPYRHRPHRVHGV
jgi:hypothetical protein